MRKPRRILREQIAVRLRESVAEHPDARRAEVRPRRIAKDCGGQVRGGLPNLHKIGFFVVDVPKNADPDAVLAALRAHPEVDRANFDEEGGVTFLWATPNDSMLNDNSVEPKYQGYTSTPGAWHLKATNVLRAWKYFGYGSPSVPLGNMDGGLILHDDNPVVPPERQAGFADVNGNVLYVENTSNPNATYDMQFGFPVHGTATLHVHSGLRGNGFGLPGIAADCTVYGAALRGSWAQAADTHLALSAMCQHGVISNSWGGHSADPALQAAMAHALNVDDCVVVCGAGNNFEEGIIYPAGFTAYTLSVGATEEDDTPSDWGVDGSSNSMMGSVGAPVDITAPGSRVWCAYASDTGEASYVTGISATPRQSFFPWRGTSFATPIVSGIAAAFARSVNPTLTAPQVIALLKETADPSRNAAHDSWFSNGLDVDPGHVNALRTGFRTAATLDPADLDARYPVLTGWRVFPIADFLARGPFATALDTNPNSAGLVIPTEGHWKFQKVVGNELRIEPSGTFDLVLDGYARPGKTIAAVRLKVNGETVYEGVPATLTANATAYDGVTRATVVIEAEDSDGTIQAETQDDVYVTTLEVALPETLAPTVAALSSPTMDEPIVLSGSAPSFLAAQITGTATASANLTVQTPRPLAAQITGTATTTASLTVPRPLAAQITGSAAVSADLTIAPGIATDAPLVVALQSPTGVTDIVITGTVPGAEVVHPLAAQITASATVSATLRVPTPHPLAAQITGNAAVVADLTHPALHPLAAQILATATVTARLSLAPGAETQFKGPRKVRLSLSGPMVKLSLSGPKVRLYLDDRG